MALKKKNVVFLVEKITNSGSEIDDPFPAFWNIPAALANTCASLVGWLALHETVKLGPILFRHL